MVLSLVYFPTQAMGAYIVCRAINCIGTNENDYIQNKDEIANHIEGRGGNDFIEGGNGAREDIYGGDGDDMVLGKSGVDAVWGGKGNDKVDGGDGADFIFGQEGNDDIAGGPEPDTIWGDHIEAPNLRSSGSDKISGGLGDDIILTDSTRDRDFHADSVNCGSGSDRVVLRSSDGDVANSNCENVYDADG